jgi:cell fate (sporulation/competence/biofilm development) regulator YlbF (YheA/YmcA/DUF963 family)
MSKLESRCQNGLKFVLEYAVLVPSRSPRAWESAGRMGTIRASNIYMNTAIDEAAILQKTRELCATIVEQPEFVTIRRRVDTFLADENAKAQYQTLMEKGEVLQLKQQQGLPMDGTEVAVFEQERVAFLNNPVARGFLDAQEEMQKIQESIGRYVHKTFELGRAPSEEDFQGGGCGSGCGCH